MGTLMAQVGEECGTQPTRSAEQLVEWLRHFYADLAERLHHGEPVVDLVPD